MGYCIEKEEGSIKIKKGNMKLVLKKISDFFEQGGQLRWVNGFTLNDEEDKSIELNEIWEDLRYGLKETDIYYEIVDFYGEKLGDDLQLFKIMAEYCEDGYLQFVGEDGEHFRIVIKNGKAIEKWPKLIWD